MQLSLLTCTCARAHVHVITHMYMDRRIFAHCVKMHAVNMLVHVCAGFSHWACVLESFVLGLLVVCRHLKFCCFRLDCVFCALAVPGVIVLLHSLHDGLVCTACV